LEHPFRKGAGQSKRTEGGYATVIPDTRPRTDKESETTTTGVRNGTQTHGNESHDVAALVAGRRLHGAKRSRVAVGERSGGFALLNESPTT
jgi:hypothetical protein